MGEEGVSRLLDGLPVRSPDPDGAEEGHGWTKTESFAFTAIDRLATIGVSPVPPEPDIISDGALPLPSGTVAEARELDDGIRRKDAELESVRGQIATLSGAADALREALERAETCRAALGDVRLDTSASSSLALRPWSLSPKRAPATSARTCFRTHKRVSIRGPVR